MRNRLTALLAAGALTVPGPAAAGATEPQPGFGPSSTGCPTFWEVDGGPQGLDISSPAGLVGTSQLHVTGFGFAVDGGDLTATIRVADMQRSVAPGTNESEWRVVFGALWFQADYYLLSDSFSFTSGKTGGGTIPVAGTIVLGPGGGIRFRVKMADVGLELPFEAGPTRASTYTEMSVMGRGTAVRWSYALGPGLVPLVRCPGLSFEASPGPGEVVIRGLTLPMTEGQPIEVQALDDTHGWRTIATGTSADDGSFEITRTMPRGAASLRGVVTTPAGIATSVPVDVEVP